jgi:hypothetical protein
MRAHVAADQAVGAGGLPCWRAHDDPGAAADLEHALAGLDRQRTQQPPTTAI